MRQAPARPPRCGALPGHYPARRASGEPCANSSAKPYREAEPLRRGSPFCHFHRVQCAGHLPCGDRCSVTSSSEHAHAEPLRHGDAYCAHHSEAAVADAPLDCAVEWCGEEYCDASGDEEMHMQCEECDGWVEMGD